MNINKFVLLIFLLLISRVFANAQSVDSANIRGIDTSNIKISADTLSYVIIDSTRIIHSDTIEKLVLSKYKSNDYNFMDNNRVLSRKYINRNDIRIRKLEHQWIVFTLLFVVLLYTIIKNIYDKTLGVIFQAYWNDRAISQFTRDDNFFKLRNSVLYFVLFALVYGLLLKYVFNYFDVVLSYKEFEEYVFICILIALFYLAKFVLLKLTGFIFSMQRLISGYLSILSVSNFVYSIIIIPLLLFYQFSDTSIQPLLLAIILILFCFNTVYKYLRTGSFVINNFQFPKFYLFLYLCTLEIMPLLIVYKVFIA